MCTICSHPKRYEIERKLLDIGVAHPELTIEAIAKEFNVSVNDLRVHAVMHAPLQIDGVSIAPCGSEDCKNDRGSMDVEDSSVATARDSIVAKTKVRESDYLKAVMDEYLVTLYNMGRRINSRAVSQDPNDLSFEKLLNKAVVDLYLGTGSEIRACVKTLAEINTMLNGPKDGVPSGLAELAAALRSSAEMVNVQ